MHPLRRKKLIYIVIILSAVALAAWLILTAFRQNMMYFYSPSDIRQGMAPDNAEIRVGGLVVDGSVERANDGLDVRFSVTDRENDVVIVYTGILPDLFREGQGIVARGRLQADGSVRAAQVLAKHDENYMPPEVADTLKPHD